jgi:hypothetical protein
VFLRSIRNSVTTRIPKPNPWVTRDPVCYPWIPLYDWVVTLLPIDPRKAELGAFGELEYVERETA